MWQSDFCVTHRYHNTLPRSARTIAIGRYIAFCYVMIAVILPTQLARRVAFSNALLSGSSAFVSKARHSRYNFGTKYIHSIPLPIRRNSYAIQLPFKNSITSLAAATGNKRPKNTYRNFSLVVQGPPGFVVPTKKKKSQRPFKLVVVESPSKCQTISKILQQYVKENNLGYDFVITSSMGHIRNIPQKKTSKDQKIAGIDLDNDYSPTYEVIEGKENMLLELQELSAATQQLILATDDDREGEAMAWHLLELLEGEDNPFLNDTKSGGTAARDKQQPLRVRFTEITRKAIVDAIENPESCLRDNLVQAQQARRVLDRLAGFTVSPILWKKIAPGLSAGRVQSVGMAMTVQRERERLTFQETEYWSVKGNFSAFDKKGIDQLLETNLISINGQTLASGTADFNPKQTNQLTPASQNKLHLTEKLAAEFANLIQTKGDRWHWNVEKVASSQRKQKPPLPFITSSLQQDANRRLGLSVSGSMRSAQQLYEKGFISYMRTDSTHLSEDARNAIQQEIVNDFGGHDKYVSEIENHGKKSSKSSKSSNDKKPDPQAAHEAIRPAVRENGRFVKPEDLPVDFDKAAVELYRLIYQRAVASHMTPQISNQTSITIAGVSDHDDTEVLFRTSGSVVIDPGYTSVYPRQVDSKSQILPPLEEGQKMFCDGVKGLAHTTQPPARYTEASFIQELEAQGVGRPSTYAGTVQSLRDRCYIGSPITSDANRRGGVKEVSGTAISAQRAAGGEDFTGAQNARGPLVPSLSAFVVTSLLEKYCKMYVDPTFTARMEERLDKIANSEIEVSENERVSYLNEFYKGEEGLASKIDYIDKYVEADIARRADLPALAWDSTENSEDIGLFIGPWGPYVMKTSGSTAGSEDDKVIKASLPPGMASDISLITLEGLDAVLKTKEQDGLILGQHPEDGRNIRLKVGPYGGYLQWGEDGEGSSTHTLPREYRSFKKPDIEGFNGEETEGSLADMIGLTLEKAIQYVNLPRTVCLMGDLPIIASIGPYGPYLKYNNTFMQLKPKDGDVLTIDGDLAQELVTEGIINRKLSAGVLAEIGEKEGAMIAVKRGRFGAYINWNKVNAKLPSDYLDDPSELPLEEAWSLIQAKAASSPGKSSRKQTNGIELPPGPKRPHSSYLIFTAEKRPEVAAKFSSLGDVSKELGRLWSELSDEDKKPYIEKAAIAKEAYLVEKAKWKKETNQLMKSKTKNTSAKSSSKNGPKRPRSAYIFFCSANRESVSKDFKTLGEITKELGRRWNDLDVTDKTEYERMSAEDKQRYAREIEELTESPANKIRATSVSKKKNGKIAPKSTKTGKQKRSPSAYMLFCASHRSQVVDEKGNKLSLPETTKVLAQMWRECDDKTRARFVEEAANKKMAMQ
mmetsp:Transcript_21170/g.58884  ORF Transcript_21170/g.58884 Transcript_21170/m.58884 type:complete len:1373 (+) Transcript_21170:276-4394(+)